MRFFNGIRRKEKAVEGKKQRCEGKGIKLSTSITEKKKQVVGAEGKGREGTLSILSLL
jgi:hypothetical protein